MADQKLFPNRLLEDQDMEMKPIVVGTPPYSSPEPETEGLQMLPLDQGTSGDHEASAVSADTTEMKAADWVDAVNNAKTQNELNAVTEKYNESGNDFATVEKAIEKKQAEFDDEE